MKTFKPAHKRYLVTLLPAMLAYSLIVALISGWLGWEPPHRGVLLYLAALSPALPIGIAIFAMGRYSAEEPDEFCRMLHIQTSLLSIGLTLFTCTAWGFLGQYAHVWVMPLYLVFPLFCFFFGLATPFVRLRYR